MGSEVITGWKAARSLEALKAGKADAEFGGDVFSPRAGTPRKLAPRRCY
jgi:hypothetical protein